MRLREEVAVYTTVYRGVEPYLPVWYESLLAQTDQEFDLWIGVDGLDPHEVAAMLRPAPRIRWVVGGESGTPARVRQQAIQAMRGRYDAVVFVDCDDLLEPTRVAAAKRWLGRCDVNACRLRLIDERGGDLATWFPTRPRFDLESVLPRANLVGLSNSAYRTCILRRCPPIPDDCQLVDWWLATAAWCRGASFGFDPVVRMAYRQHPSNLAILCPPFSAAQIVRATQLVRGHYRTIERTSAAFDPSRVAVLRRAAARVERFWQLACCQPGVLDRYVSQLNQSTALDPWWSIVAHPNGERLWHGKAELARASGG
jgi:hypothetical protein